MRSQFRIGAEGFFYKNFNMNMIFQLQLQFVKYIVMNFQKASELIISSLL